MPDKTKDTKIAAKPIGMLTAEEAANGLRKAIDPDDNIVGIAVFRPDYDNKEVVNEGPSVTDLFISFRDTDHEHPYNVPEIVKIEEIFCFMIAYRKPWRRSSRKSLKNYRNRLTKYCRGCSRFPSDCKKLVHVMVTTKSFKRTYDTCRIRYLKEAMTREIRGPIVKVVGGSIKIEVQ